jgi:tripartite-type tricarboxylate transporter receptor subunit TctC
MRIKKTISYLAFGLILASNLFAQSYPNKSIRLIMPFSAGGPSDVLARALAKSLSDGFGQPVLVENKTGAGGSLGIDLVAKSNPDGYTLGFAHTGSTAINPHLYTQHPYDTLNDLTPITPIVSYNNVLLVNPLVPARNMKDFLVWIKANPTKATYASGGNGATNHLSGELLKSLTGINLTHVPYKGNAPAMIDVISGNVTCIFDIPTTAIPQVKAGKVFPLAIASNKRSSFMPEVPTMREAGVIGFEEAGSDLWFGLVGPANLPKPIVDRIYQETLKALKTPALQEAIRGMAYDIWTLPPEDFKNFIRLDYAKWGKVVKLSGAKVD